MLPPHIPGRVPPELERALQELGSGREPIRTAAVKRLAQAGPAAAPALVSLLKGTTRRAQRESAIQALTTMGDSAVPELAAALNSASLSMRDGASRALQGIGTAAARAALCEGVKVGAPAAERGPRDIGLASLGACCAVCSAGWVIWNLGTGQAMGVVFWLLLLGGSVKLAASTKNGLPMGGHEPLLRSLEACDTPAMVNAVAAWLSDGNVQVRIAARLALLRCLAGVDAENAAAITPQTRQSLIACLSEGYVAVCEAVLRALSYVPDPTMLVPVERLASGRAPCSVDAAVRQAARDCLPAIREIAATEKLNARLVRPVEAQPETLVRPAGAGSDESEALLRPSKE